MRILIYFMNIMIIKEDIKPHELVTVLVEEEMIAKVLSNEGDYLLVTYLSPSDKVYKRAKVFKFEAKAERVDFESLTSHHPDVIDVAELGLFNVGTNMFVYEEDIDSESESEVETDDSDSDSAGSLDDFVVPDDQDVCLKPCDHQEIDEAWGSWKPSSAGAKRFKQRVDQIEAYMNNEIDEKFIYFKNKLI
jgi:hypothetical protein